MIAWGDTINKIMERREFHDPDCSLCGIKTRGEFSVYNTKDDRVILCEGCKLTADRVVVDYVRTFNEAKKMAGE